MSAKFQLKLGDCPALKEADEFRALGAQPAVRWFVDAQQEVSAASGYGHVRYPSLLRVVFL